MSKVKEINGYHFTINSQILELLNNYDEQKYAPKRDQIFKALELTNFNNVKIVILGQDPYPIQGDACGLSFAVMREQMLPKSLANIFKELKSDLGISRYNGDLSDWAKQGILLLNTSLSVRLGVPNSHQNYHWDEITSKIINDLSNRGQVIFVLLGKHAEKYQKIINQEQNSIIKTSHPSPLAAYRGFLGSNIFSQIDKQLLIYQYPKMQWGK